MAPEAPVVIEAPVQVIEVAPAEVIEAAPVEAPTMFEIIGAQKDVDNDTSETSSYKSSSDDEDDEMASSTPIPGMGEPSTGEPT